MVDIHTALEIADRLERLQRRADRFGMDRTRLIEEIVMIAEDYRILAAYTEQQMVEEMG